jgi:type IX secretion system PorP/SprF family membrane protein
MRKLIKNTLLLSLVAFAGKANAQVDPHFTQYYVYPAWLNPALTGAFDGNIRASGIYRTQWGNVSSPYTTPGFSVDMTTDKNVNVGVSVLRQNAGNGGYSYTTAYGSVAYTGVRFGVNETKRLVFALQGGLIQRRFDPNKMTFGDQWNPVTGYNPNNQTMDIINTRSASSFDAGAGVLYYDAQPGKKANIFGGYSVAHLTKPTDDFSTKSDATLPMRHTIHGGVRFSINEVFSLTPNILYLRQGTASEKMLGAYATVKATDNTEFLVGANYRFNDAVSPYVGFYYKNMVLGASYDINTSDLGKMAKGSNSFEVSLSFVGKKSVKTPAAEFVCPRL